MKPMRPALFVADSLGIDLLNSKATPGGKTVDWLWDGEGLIGWLHQASLVDEGTVRELRALAMPGEFDGVAAQARELREWFREFVAEHRGSPLSPESLDELTPLNALLERDEAYREVLLGEGGVIEVVTRRRWRAPGSLLLPLADVIADTICRADFAQIKSCEGTDCSLMFLDLTAKHARRWCRMASCGNRAKQAAHRARLKEIEP